MTQPQSPAQTEVPQLQIIPIPKDQVPKLSLFSKLVLNPPKGSTFGVLKFGALCIHQRDLTWEQGPQVLDQEDIRTAFNQVFQKANYPVAGNVDNLFEDVSGAELILAGLVKELHADICNKLTLGFVGPREALPVADLSLKVNWQVFSRVDDKVVYEVATNGKYSGPGNLREGVIGAFANATEKLLADRRFYDLVVQKKGMIPHNKVPSSG
ncbi:MAG TPA: hypothetical protein VGJ57_01140 [Nitrospirales bacterium]